MNKENSIAFVVFFAVILFSIPLCAGAESLDDEVKRLELEIKKKELEQKLRKMKESESGTQFAPPPPGNPLDPNFYNPGQMPQTGSQSRLRGQQGIDDGPYTGVDGMTQRAGENCELLEKRRQAQIPTLNLQGMNIASVTLEQKGNGVHYTGDITLYGPSKGCIPIYNTKNSGSFNAFSPSGTVEIAWVYVEFDGISLIKFPVIGKRAGVANLGQPHVTKIGDMQTGSLFLRDVNATVTIGSAQQQSINIFQQKTRP